MFPRNQWYVAALSGELQDKPIARTLLGQPVVLFRTPSGEVAALEDRCCHRQLPLSYGTLEATGIRCGYHGLLFGADGKCLEIPGQEKVPAKAFVKPYTVKERNQIVWIWIGQTDDTTPTCEPPEYAVHDNPKYQFKGGLFHYEAPYQLIHDNLLDLSHLGYVHLKTIGGNARLHMNAPTRVEGDGDTVRVVRWMKDSTPPPTYTAAWPYKGLIDRWQEIEFNLSYLAIWTGATDAGAEDLANPERGGFHMRGFHGITPETETTSHYFWTIASNSHPDCDDNFPTVYEQTKNTFAEDKVIIEAQYQNMLRFDNPPGVDIHVDVGANRARRIISRLNLQTLEGTGV